MITKFRLRDFKGHCDTQLDLGRFTLLVGDNGSGKTSVLDALSLQARISRHNNLLQGTWSPQDLLRRGSHGPITFVSVGTKKALAWHMTLELHVAPKSPDKVRKPWELTLEGHLDGAEFKATESSKGVTGDWSEVASTLGIAGLYRLSAEKIAAAAYSNKPEARIKLNGTDTAVALAAMKLGNDEAFKRVEDAMRKLIPAVERVRIRPTTVRLRSSTARHPSSRRTSSRREEVVGHKLYFDFRGAPGVPAHGASHGTLIVLALLAVLHGPNRPDLILLDDFDHALHPRAQMELVRMIKDLLTLEEFKDVQVVATTHSPYMLDELEPSDVQAFALRDDGTVASKRLSEHPEAERTRGTIKAGQLWSLDPERDWVLRG